MVEFECRACGYYRDTPNHDLGCLPFHNVSDENCLARAGNEKIVAGALCRGCLPPPDTA